MYFKTNTMKNFIYSILSVTTSFSISFTYSQSDSLPKNEIMAALAGTIISTYSKVYLPTHPSKKYYISQFTHDSNNYKLFRQLLDETEMSLQDFEIDTYVGDSYKIDHLYSKKYFKKLHTHYEFKKAKDKWYDQDLDKEYKLKFGTIDTTKFSSKSEKLAFLIGLFSLYGEFEEKDSDEKVLSYRFAPDQDRFKKVQTFLNQTGSRIQSACYYGDRIPGGMHIFFKPSEEFLNLLEKFDIQENDRDIP